MIRWATRRTLCVGACLWTISLFGVASITVAAVVGDQVELRATHQAGVPFHSAPGGTPTFQRVPAGTVATMTDLARDGRWLELRLADARAGWVAARYVGSGGRMAPADPAIPRVGTWNVRGFPRGCPSN